MILEAMELSNCRSARPPIVVAYLLESPKHMAYYVTLWKTTKRASASVWMQKR